MLIQHEHVVVPDCVPSNELLDSMFAQSFDRIDQQQHERVNHSKKKRVVASCHWLYIFQEKISVRQNNGIERYIHDNHSNVPVKAMRSSGT